MDPSASAAQQMRTFSATSLNGFIMYTDGKNLTGKSTPNFGSAFLDRYFGYFGQIYVETL